MGSVFQNAPAAQYRRYVPKIKRQEDNVQLQLCRWLRLQHPKVIFRSDFASGQHMTMHQAAKHKSLQSSRSFPDLFIYTPSREFHGMALEIKKEGVAIKVTKGPRKGELVANPHIQEQAVMLTALNKLGYFARFGVGLDSCIDLINWYLVIEKTPPNGELF